MSRAGKSIGTASRVVVARTWEKGREDRVITKGSGVSFWGDKSVLKLTVVIVAPLCECTESTELDT